MEYASKNLTAGYSRKMEGKSFFVFSLSVYDQPCYEERAVADNSFIPETLPPENILIIK